MTHSSDIPSSQHAEYEVHISKEGSRIGNRKESFFSCNRIETLQWSYIRIDINIGTKRPIVYVTHSLC
jgi:hypothetical protein